LQSKLFIGLPVYNVENTIIKTLDSITSQTFKEFTLLISDNNSTDSTASICKEFTKIDSRIQYIKQQKNIGWLNNFLFLLDHANSKYFVWIAGDDYWNIEFLEKNIKILDSQSNLVGSFSKIGVSGDYFHKFDFNKKDNFIQNFYKKIRRHYLSLDLYDISGETYEERIRLCLKSSRYGLYLFSVFHTDILKKSVNFNIHPWDWGLILIILKYGRINKINEILTYRSSGGTSNTNIFIHISDKKRKLKQILFPKSTFTKWFFKNIGKKIFFQNFGYFVKLSFSGPMIILLDLIKYLKFLNSKKLSSAKNG
jgi:glycosyltransferase involved in cell wall biosynthesis